MTGTIFTVIMVLSSGLYLGLEAYRMNKHEYDKFKSETVTND